MKTNSFLNNVPPMGIYETLYAFQNSFGTYMGEKGTHPWSQGFPLTTKIPNGPELPKLINIESNDLSIYIFLNSLIVTYTYCG